MLIIAAATAVAAMAAQIVERQEPQPLPYEDFEAPVSNPPADPNRPDLWEEPVIDERADEAPG